MITKTLLVVNGLTGQEIPVKVNHKETRGSVKPQIVNNNNFNNVLFAGNKTQKGRR